MITDVSLRILSFDPAGKKFGVAGVHFQELSVDELINQKLTLYLTHVIETPVDFSSSQRTLYMAHASAALASIDKPDMLVSEKPWGQGYSKDSLLQLIGAIKAETWKDIEWQGVSEARRAVLGDTWGNATKRVTAEWLLQYPWDRSSKNTINKLLAEADPNSDEGYDVLDAILHALCYLVANKGLKQIAKVKKEKKRASKSKEIKP